MSQVAYSQQSYPGQSRIPSAEAVSRHLHKAHAANKAHAHDYTLQHHGRQVRIGPVAFWIVVGTLVVMGVWSIATGTYFAFRDDVLTGLLGRQDVLLRSTSAAPRRKRLQRRRRLRLRRRLTALARRPWAG